jgi:nanoRNase/pAp phosphatase (c-di-AMP/oligoRNAs hydrolase)
MRLVTYGTMDGLSSAVLITEVEPIDSIELIHPQAITVKRFKVQEGDILANVPHRQGCAKWFDHHDATSTYSEPPAEFEGRYGLARSCARLVYDYYLPDNPQIRRFEELIHETDRFASADLSIEEVTDPERYILIGFTVDPRSGLSGHKDYFRKMVEWMKSHSMDELLELDEVRKRTERLLREREDFLNVMRAHSRQVGNVIVTDLRDVEKIPVGDRFLIYTLFPEANVSLRVERGAMGGLVVARAGHSIFNRTSPVHLGSLMARYGGGGRRGTAATPLSPEYADRAIDEMLEELQKA